MRVNYGKGFSGCVACWRSIIARPIVANILLWRNRPGDDSLAVVVGNPNTHVTHGLGRGWQWLLGPCCSPVCCVYFTFRSNIWIIVCGNNGSVSSDGGRASSRRTMSLETLLEAARYVELQEAQRLQQSSSSLSSLARGTAGMFQVAVITLKCALISEMLGIPFVYVC